MPSLSHYFPTIIKLFKYFNIFLSKNSGKKLTMFSLLLGLFFFIFFYPIFPVRSFVLLPFALFLGPIVDLDRPNVIFLIILAVALSWLLVYCLKTNKKRLFFTAIYILIIAGVFLYLFFSIESTLR